MYIVRVKKAKSGEKKWVCLTVKRGQTIVYLMWNVNRRVDRSSNIRFDKSIFAQFYHTENACILIKRAIQSNEDISTICDFVGHPDNVACWTNAVSASTYFSDFAGHSSWINTMQKEKNFQDASARKLNNFNYCEARGYIISLKFLRKIERVHCALKSCRLYTHDVIQNFCLRCSHHHLYI